MPRHWPVVCLCLIPVLATCVQREATAGGAVAMAAPPNLLDAPVVRVRSDFYYPVAISLVGDGVMQLGVVDRDQVRYFWLPARVASPETYVAIEARPVPRSGADALDALASFTSKLLSLHPGDTIEVRLEHTLTLSTLQVHGREGAANERRSPR